MKIYGYNAASTQDVPSELSEVTISASSKTLMELSEFFKRCAEQIEENGEAWEHEHFESECFDGGTPSVVVFNEKLS